MSAAIVYAFTLGLVAAVNPCGFPLLPAYLAGFIVPEPGSGWVRRTTRALVAGSCVTLGFVLTFGLCGVLISTGAVLVADWIPWAMLAVGAALAVIGIMGLAGKHPAIRLPAVRFAGGGGPIAMAGFGVAYAVGSLSCTLPLFLAGVSGSFVRAGLLSGLTSFIAYGFGMGVFVIGATLIVAHVGAASLRTLRPLSRFVPAIASVLVTVAGLYLLYYWITALTDPLAASPLTAAVDTVQAAVSDWLTTWPAMALAGVTITAALAALAWNSLRHRDRDQKKAEENAEHA